MKVVLQYIGFAQKLLTLIDTIYSQPAANIKTNDTLLDTFILNNGTRQGCPLSPLTFILTLEPLLCQITANPNISRIATNLGEHKLAGYVDDLLLFVTQLLISLPNLLTEFHIYNVLSNFKINLQKLVALNINVDQVTLQNLKAHFLFKCPQTHIKYLDSYLTSSKFFFSTNFASFLTKIRQVVINPSLVV